MPYIGNVPKYGDTIDNFKKLDDISSYTWTFDASLASVVNVTTNKFTSLSHRFVQGQKVTYDQGGMPGTPIGGLSDGSYYIIRDDQNTFRLASSALNASSATAIDITSVGNGTQTLNVSFDGYNTKFKPTWGDGAHSIRISDAAQLMISMNGVIQKPDVTGVGGFDIDNGNISFAVAPDASDVFWGNSIGDRISSFDISDNKVDNFTGNGTEIEFNLSRICPTNQSLLVTIDGVVQHPTDNQGAKSYSIVNGNVLTFTSAPSLGALIQARHIGFAGGAAGGGGGVTSLNGRTGAVSLQSGDPGVGVGIQTASGVAGYGATIIDFRGPGVTTAYYSSATGIGTVYFQGGGSDNGFIETEITKIVDDNTILDAASGNILYTKAQNVEIANGKYLEISDGDSLVLDAFQFG
jgi:hypothetical protein